MSNKNVVIETLQKKRAELESERQKKWSEITKNIQEIDDALSEMGVWTPKEAKLDPIYDDQNPDYVRSSSVED